MHNTCFRPKLKLFWHVCFTWKNKTFGCCWLFLRPASEPKNDFCCCCYVQYMLWICLWVCPGNLPPLVPGGSLGGIITHLASKEELLCSLIPSPPHKCYFLSYLAPTARVSEGILHLEGFFVFFSQLICKQGWSHFASLRGAQDLAWAFWAAMQPCLSQDNGFCPECVSSPRNSLAVCHCPHGLLAHVQDLILWESEFVRQGLTSVLCLLCCSCEPGFCGWFSLVAKRRKSSYLLIRGFLWTLWRIHTCLSCF